MSLSRIGDLSERLTVPTWLEILLHAAGAAVVLAYLNFFLGVIPWENDAWGFYIAWEGGLYDISWLDRYAYVYSPAFAQAIAPFGGLDWEVYRFGWIVIQLIAPISTNSSARLLVCSTDITTITNTTTGKP